MLPLMTFQGYFSFLCLWGHGCKHEWCCLIHLLARPIDFVCLLINSDGYHLEVTPIRIGEHHAVKRLCQVVHHVRTDDRRTGEQQPFTLPGSARGRLLLHLAFRTAALR